MVCRSTPIGSALTSYVKILDGVEEYQSLSLYHELMREAPSRLPSVSNNTKQDFIDQMAAKIETSDSFTTARKRSLQDRLANARDTTVSPDVFYATERIEERTRAAKTALDDYYLRTARDLGESVNLVRARLSSSYEESRRERSMVAPESWVTEFQSRPGNRNLPMDRHTAYAMWRIDNEVAENGENIESRPTVTNHQRLGGTGVFGIGYDQETGRLEVEFRSRPGQYYAYQNVPASIYNEMLESRYPTRIFNESIRNNIDHQYADQADAEAAGIQHRCPTCGQFAGDSHGCPPRDSRQEMAVTIERSRMQQAVLRARRAVASGSRSERLTNFTNTGLSIREAEQRVESENRAAQMSPDTTLRHRQRQHLSARIYPYRGASGMFRCTALSTVRRIADEEPFANVPVVARINRVEDENGEPTGIAMGTVEGRVHVSNTNGTYEVSDENIGAEDTLRCTCLEYRRTYDCPHVRQVIGDMNRRLNQRILSDPHTISDAVREANSQAHTQYEESVVQQATAQEEWNTGGDGVSYGEDAAAFQEDYDAAKARIEAGQEAVPYMTENATDGLGAVEGGRGFGVELEFDFPDDMDEFEREDALAAIGADLCDLGLTNDDRMQDYHAASYGGYNTQHEGGWSFEEDGSVAGEIVSPIMHDTQETWENIQKVCDILNNHGAVANVHVGSHVHVSTHNYDHTVENHNRLVGLVNEHEDDLYRLASNPERGTHRTRQSMYTRPNPHRANGYANINEVARYNSGYYGLNMEDTVNGRSSDHAEFRVWDGTLNPSVIQSQIKMSLAMTEAAFRDTDYVPTGHNRIGSTRETNRETRDGSSRLTGEEWRESTQRVRNFADRLFRRREDKAQLASLFAATKWQRS